MYQFWIDANNNNKNIIIIIKKTIVITSSRLAAGNFEIAGGVIREGEVGAESESLRGLQPSWPCLKSWLISKRMEPGTPRKEQLLLEQSPWPVKQQRRRPAHLTKNKSRHASWHLKSVQVVHCQRSRNSWTPLLPNTASSTRHWKQVLQVVSSSRTKVNTNWALKPKRAQRR